MVDFRKVLAQGTHTAPQPSMVPLSQVLGALPSLKLGLPTDPQVSKLDFGTNCAWLVEFTRHGSKCAGMSHQQAAVFAGKVRSWLHAPKNRTEVQEALEVFANYQDNPEHRKYVGFALWVHWRVLEFAKYRLAKGDSQWQSHVYPAYLWGKDVFKTPMLRGMYKKARLQTALERGDLSISPYAAHQIATAYNWAQQAGLLASWWSVVQAEIEFASITVADDMADIQSAINHAHETVNLAPWLSYQKDIIPSLRLEGRAVIGIEVGASDVARHKVLSWRRTQQALGLSGALTLTAPQGNPNGPRTFARNRKPNVG